MHFSKRLFETALILLVLSLSSSLSSPIVTAADAEIPATSFAQVMTGGNALFIPADLPDGVSNTSSVPRNTVRTRYARLNFGALAQAESSQNLGHVTNDSGLRLDLFDGLSYVAFNTRIEARPTGDSGYVWVGTIPEIPYSDVILVVGEGVFSGQIISTEGSYAFNSIDADLVAIHEIGLGSSQNLIADDVLIPDAPSASTNTAAPSLDGVYLDDGSFIDVMVVYSQNARIYAGSTSEIRAFIDTTVTMTNTSYTNSNLDLRLRLVHTAEVNYDDSRGMFQSLRHVRERVGSPDDPTGLLDHVHELRDQYGADLVAFITNGPDGCGVATLLTSMDDIAHQATLGFSVSEVDCILGGITFAHEIGHNLGGAHDRANSGFSPMFDYAYGYQNPIEGFVTIMSYTTGGSCVNYCYYIGRFSSPFQKYNGKSVGSKTPPTNMVKTFNNTRTFVANYRPSKTFTLSKFNLISPADDFIATDPALTFTWERQTQADTFRLHIKDEVGAVVFMKDVPAGACTATCSVTVPGSPTWKPPVNKDLKWTVTARRTLNDAIYQPNPRRTIIPRFLPKNIALYTPTAAAPINNQFITFEWKDDPRIDEYQIIITDPVKKLKKVGWSARDVFGCDGTTCSAPVDMASFNTPAPKGTYKWQVFGRRDETTGSISSAKRDFRANFYPTQITLTTPTQGETADTRTPTFAWNEVEGLTQYRVIVRKVTNGHIYQSPWTNAESICTDSVCTLDTLTLPTGALTWEVWGHIANLAGKATSVKSKFKIRLTPAPTS